MKVGWRHLTVSVAALFAAGMLTVWSGVIDIKASSGHWRVTDCFLHWAMRSSVRTAAIGTEVPDLSNPAYLPLAAGHYETACAGCHGSPERKQSPVTAGMLPPPPEFADVVGSWSDAQLFEIVKHGVRYTGMPAWPAIHRDDEVWAMVAFLRGYPELDAEGYRRLTSGRAPESAGLETSIAACDSCHAPSRLLDNSLIPVLDAQSEAYLLDSLRAFRSAARPSGVMQAAVSGRNDDALIELAATYARRSVANKQNDAVPALVSLGDAQRSIPACSTCHDKAGLNPVYPRLAGLGRDYIRNQLRLFRADIRGGAKFQHLMTRAAKNLTDDDIELLARYYGR